ncbi:unnamed protein product, partial [marine sediment metagenome]
AEIISEKMDSKDALVIGERGLQMILKDIFELCYYLLALNHLK